MDDVTHATRLLDRVLQDDAALDTVLGIVIDRAWGHAVASGPFETDSEVAWLFGPVLDHAWGRVHRRTLAKLACIEKRLNRATNEHFTKKARVRFV